MTRKAFLVLFLLSILGKLIAQDQPADSLLADLLQESVPESSDLLPEKMLFTQRFFLGRKRVVPKSWSSSKSVNIGESGT